MKFKEKNTIYYKQKLINYPLRYSFFHILKYVKDKYALDVGCGVGHYLSFFNKKSIGIDVSERNMKMAKKRGLNIQSYDLNLGLRFKDNLFEVVFMSHILEHIDNPIFLLRESYRVLNKRGLLVLGLPIEESLVRLLGDDYYNDHPGHLYSFTVKCIRNLCYKVGFKNEIDLKYELPLIQSLGLIKFSALINKFLPKLLISPLSSAYWILFQK